MTQALAQAQQALTAFDREPDLPWLRNAAQALMRVDLLSPAQPGERLALRAQVLAGWLALVVRLDTLQAALDQPDAGDSRSIVQRNRLAWQCDAFDQELSARVEQFIAQYYTPAPVDRAELDSAMESSGLAPHRRSQWHAP